ncbi:MAG: sodium:solute symporter family protein [Nocardioidaceae bacterium]|nr:sodium:solute symporter family protein [Nocardioidaceae bacterium]
MPQSRRARPPSGQGGLGSVVHLLAAPVDLRLDLSAVDIFLLVTYFVFVIGIGFALKRAVKSSSDFFLSGRSLPAWITGLAFISANLGAVEILGQSASAAEYGASVVHYFWIGAIPAMVFLGIVMMPFYYGSKVRSVPEYLRLRYDRKAHLINAITFVVASLLIAGVNLFALATVIDALLGIPLWWAIVLSAAFVLSYILLGGLSSAIYNEVLQFFVILAGLIPLVVIAVKEVGGLGALFDTLGAQQGPTFNSAWTGTGPGGANLFGDFFGIIVGLGFCLSFGYWTTNFAEVQRAMAAKSTNAARMTPIIGAYPKLFIPLITILPGMCALLLIPGLGSANGVDYNNAIPALMDQYLPAGALGVAVTGLVAAFMAGMAANVSSFNAVFTHDLWEEYVRPGRSDRYYLVVGRLATVVGVLVGIGTAGIAANFENISNYFQVLFTFFNVPLFVTFIVGMFWKRASPSSGFWGILVGTFAAVATYVLYKFAGVLDFRSDLHESFWGGIVGFVFGAVTIVVVSMFGQGKPEEELRGLVHGMELRDMDEGPQPFYRRPVPMGMGALALSAALYVIMAGL